MTGMNSTLPEQMRDAGCGLDGTDADPRWLLIKGAEAIDKLTLEVQSLQDRLTLEVQGLQNDVRNAEAASKYYEEMSLRLQAKLALSGRAKPKVT